MILRLIIYILFLCTLNGCVQGLAFLGPAFSYSQSGNIMQSAISYGTNKALKKSKWGMFCIPGIANLDDVKLLKDMGANFIRIGSNVENYKLTEPYIKLAKKLKMKVCSNFMKSYVLSPKNFSKTSGIQYQDGPISKVNPSFLNWRARPPGVEFFSNI